MAVFSPTVVCPPPSHDLIDGFLEIPDAGTGSEGREFLGLLHESGAATVERRYARGEVLFGEGDPGDALYVVDFGVMTIGPKGPEPKPGTGVLWRITREGVR